MSTTSNGGIDTPDVKASEKEKIPDDPYTHLFLPLKHWDEVTKKRDEWLGTYLAGRFRNYEKMEEKAILRAGRSVSERWTDEKVLGMATQESWYHFGIIGPRDTTLPIPRPDQTFGYSWTAWNQAARYAGGREPPFSLRNCLQLVEAGLDYWLEQFKSWKENPEEFSVHLKEVCDPTHMPFDNGNVHAGQPMLVTVRVQSVIQGITGLASMRDSLYKMIDLGMAEGGNTAKAQVLSPGPIHDEYVQLIMKASNARVHTDQALQFAYARGRGYQYMEPREPNGFWKKFGDYSPLPIFKARLPREEFSKVSYLDSILAGCCGGFAEDGTRSGFPFEHFLLEYEQGLRDNPQWPEQLGDHLQRLIGESAMASDVLFAIGRHFDRATDHFSRWAKENEPSIAPTEHRTPFDKYWKVIYGCIHTVIEQDTPLSSRAGQDLWDQWEIQAQAYYGTTVFDILGIDLLNSSMKSSASGVDQSLHQQQNLEEPNQLTQTGHSFLKSQPEATKKAKACTTIPSSQTPKSQVIDAEEEAVATQIPPKKFLINNKQMKLVERLFSNPAENRQSGQVRWDDIYKLMKRIGFRIDHVGGSIYRFVPPNNAGMPFNEHRPHPEVSIGSVRYQAFGKRIQQRYGWSIDSFVKGSQVN